MKNMGLKVATIICGGLAGINGLLAVLGLICLMPDMCLFFAVPTLIFGFPTIKLAKKIGWIKPKVKANKVKEETKVESEQLMFDLKEEPVKEEKPVDNVVQFKQKENKEEPKEEKQPESKEEMSIGKAILTLIGVGLAFLGIGAVIVGIIALIGYVGFYIVSFILQALMYIGGFLIAAVLIVGFIKFWWSLVIHEHVDKPRGIIRVKVKNRRW